MKYPMAANLNDEGKKEFNSIFPENQIPVLNPIAQDIPIEGSSGKVEITVNAFMVNLFLLTAQEKKALCTKLANKFNAPVETVQKDVEERGLPLRSKYVSSVSIDPRFLL